MIYRQTRNAYENLNKMMFPGVGEYQTPEIIPTQYKPQNFIGFNFAKTCKEPAKSCVHFFIDDYQFQRVWQYPEQYTEFLSKFNAVCSPDFSGYLDFPKSIRIYNHFRNHWLGAYWQAQGLTVIPTIQWCDECDFDWCFDGDPVGSTVAVSSVGTQSTVKGREVFKLGFHEMLRRLEPTTILLYGLIPAGCEDDRIIRIPAFQEKHRKKRG